MCNHQKRTRPPQHAVERKLDIFRIEGCEALVENHDLSALQQSAGNVDAAALPVRELPAGLPNHLQHSCWHLVHQRLEAEFATNRRRFSHVFFAWRPAASHQEVERKGFGEYMILVELRRGNHSLTPALLAQG